MEGLTPAAEFKIIIGHIHLANSFILKNAIENVHRSINI